MLLKWIKSKLTKSKCIYIESADKKLNDNYVVPASLQDIANQIARAEGTCAPNRDYLFQLLKELTYIGCEDRHFIGMANEVRSNLSGAKLTSS